MGLESIPQAVRDKYHIDERGHASAILASDYPNEFKDIMDCLGGFVLKKSHVRVHPKFKNSSPTVHGHRNMTKGKWLRN